MNSDNPKNDEKTKREEAASEKHAGGQRQMRFQGVEE